MKMTLFILAYASSSLFFGIGSSSLNKKQTITYIEEKYPLTVSLSLGTTATVKVSDNGTVTLCRKWPKGESKSVLEIGNVEFIRVDKAETGSYILQFKCKKGGCLQNSSTMENLPSDNNMRAEWFKTKQDADRMFKAFIHLQKLLNSEKDPFDGK